MDRCADNPRTHSAADNDDLLNPCWGGAYGYCPDVSANRAYRYTTACQIDHPMAYLLRESNNRFFALAFAASKARVDPYNPPVAGGKAKDISENFYDLATVTNGEPTPTTMSPAVGKNNIITWQPVPGRFSNSPRSIPETSVVLIGGVLLSEQAVDTVAERNHNAVLVRFRTTSEWTVTGIDILGRGDAVVSRVPCTQCTSGMGDSYEVLLTPGDLKGSREPRVRLNGPDAVSEPFPIR